MGMYGLLESATLLDLLEIKGLRVWGPERTMQLNLEAQRFWFLALGCAVASGLLQLINVFAYAPVPVAGSGYGTGEEKARGEDDARGVQGESDWKEERERLRQVVAKRKEERIAWRREVRARSAVLLRKLVTDSLDMLIPGNVIGWVKVDPGTVALAMFTTTLLTSVDVWRRCGYILQSRRAR